MYTFNKMWGVVTPEEAAAKIEDQKKEITGEPKNLEEQAISLVGRDTVSYTHLDVYKRQVPITLLSTDVPYKLHMITSIDINVPNPRLK